MEIGLRNKKDYLQPKWEEVYTTSKQLKKDIEFYCDEIHFLRNLIDKYFVWLIDMKNIARVKNLVSKLVTKDREQQEIASEIDKHLVHLKELINNNFTQDEEPIRKTHLALLNQFADFTDTLKSVKKEVFSLTEFVLETEKVKQLQAH